MNFKMTEVDFNSTEELNMLIKEAKRENGTVMVRTELTPTSAQIALERNAHNRNPNEPDTQGMVRDLESRSNWEDNGETLKFDKKGKLIDGQKRCMAVIRAGKGFPSYVVFNANSAKNINRGQRESNGDKARRLGFLNPNVASGVAGMLEKEHQGFYPFAHDLKITPAELERRLTKDEEDILDACDLVVSFARSGMRRHGSYGFIYLKLLEKCPRGPVDAFFDQLTTGEEIQKGSPVGALRRRLVQDNLRTSSGGAKTLNTVEKCYLILRCFRAVRMGEEMKGMMLPKSGVTKDNVFAPLKGLR